MILLKKTAKGVKQ